MAESTGQQKLGTISKYKEVQEPDVMSNPKALKFSLTLLTFQPKSKKKLPTILEIPQPKKC